MDDWIQQLEAKRDACYSTVVVVETNDDRRSQEYLTYLIDEKKKEVLVWDTFEGLTKRREGSCDSIDVGMLDGEITYIENYITEKSRDAKAQMNRTVVIKNVLAASDLPMKALNTWAMDNGLIGQANTLVLFTPDRGLVNSKVLDKCIFISPPYSTPVERLTLLGIVLQESEGKGIITERLKVNEDAMVEATGGLNLCQTEAVFWETMYDFAINQREEFGTDVISRAKADIINKNPSLKIRKDLTFGFERVGGYEPLKQYIIENIVQPLKSPGRAKDLGMELPRGIILFGPGGTGKTIFAKSLAKEVGMPFATLSPENFMTSFVGESEKQLRDIIRLLEEMAPVVVLIDEIDRLGGRGDGGESDGGTSKRLFSQFLEWFGDEARKTFVIGATNAPYMDAAFRREGRFDCIVPMLSPDKEARKAILNVHLNVVRKVRHSIDDLSIDAIASITEGWKGNMLEELVKRAVRLAFTQGDDTVTNEHLSDAYKDYRINKDALNKDEEKYIKIAQDMCNSKKFLESLLGEADEGNGRMKAIREAKK